MHETMTIQLVDKTNEPVGLYSYNGQFNSRQIVKLIEKTFNKNPNLDQNEIDLMLNRDYEIKRMIVSQANIDREL